MWLLSLLAKRSIVSLLTMLAVSVFVFIGLDLLPGDAASAALGSQASDPDLLAQRRAEMGLDRPVVVRYLEFLGDLAHADLGTSASGQPVWGLIEQPLKYSAVLAVAAMLVLVPVALAVGVWMAMKQDRLFDHVASASTLALVSTPEFVLGPLLAVMLSRWLGLLPSVSLMNSSESVFSQIDLLVMPVLTLVLVLAAQASRLVRAVAVDVLASPYVEQAVLAGASTWSVVRRHVLPNAGVGAIQVFALTTAYLIGGVVVTEAVFGYPGLGMTLASAVGSRDLQVVTVVSLLMVGVYIVVNLIADLLVQVLDPRVRAGQ